MKNKIEMTDVHNLLAIWLLACFASTIISCFFVIVAQDNIATASFLSKHPVILITTLLLVFSIGPILWVIWHKTNFGIQIIKIEQIDSPISVHRDGYSGQYHFKIGNNYEFWLEPSQIEITDSEKPISGPIVICSRIESVGPFYNVQKSYSADNTTIQINTESSVLSYSKQ